MIHIPQISKIKKKMTYYDKNGNKPNLDIRKEKNHRKANTTKIRKQQIRNCLVIFIRKLKMSINSQMNLKVNQK